MSELSAREGERLKPEGLWLYAPTLTEELEASFEAQLTGEAPSRNADYERYTHAPHRRARWLYRHAQALRADLWRALCERAGLPHPTDDEALLVFVGALSEAERLALLAPLEAELTLSEWPEYVQADVRGLSLPPRRYELEVRPSDALTLYLAPIMHLALTRIDAELGRTLGDALDGPKPL